MSSPPKYGAPYVSPTLKDPNVTVGRFRILPRADGAFIVYDPDQALGRRTAAEGASVEHATSKAAALVEAERVAAEEAKMPTEPVTPPPTALAPEGT